MIEYQEANNIPGNIESTVLSFINTGSDKLIQSIKVEGSARSEWFVYFNLQKKIKLRLSNSYTKKTIPLFKVNLATNDIIEIKVIHYESTLNNFSSEVNFG
jgi:hypothetical protein